MIAFSITLLSFLYFAIVGYAILQVVPSRRGLVNRCTKRSQAATSQARFTTRTLSNPRLRTPGVSPWVSTDERGSVVDLRQQLRGVQSTESPLGDQGRTLYAKVAACEFREPSS